MSWWSAWAYSWSPTWGKHAPPRFDGNYSPDLGNVFSLLMMVVVCFFLLVHQLCPALGSRGIGIAVGLTAFDCVVFACVCMCVYVCYTTRELEPTPPSGLPPKSQTNTRRRKEKRRVDELRVHYGG